MLWRAYLVSVGLHASLFLGWLLFGSGTTAYDASSLSQRNLPSKSTIVESISENDLASRLRKALKAKERQLTPKERQLTPKERQIAQMDESTKTEVAPVEDGRKRIFDSKFNAVVDQNTRAAQVGKFKNNFSTDKLFQIARNEKDEEQERALTRNTGRLKTEPPHSSARSPASSMRTPIASVDTAALAPQAGPSATDDFLEDIAVGAHTLLNTREYVFYGFYERIRERLTPHWHGALDQEVSLLRANAPQGALTMDRRTKVEVELFADGTLKHVRVLSSSGVAELDRAATHAFRGAAPFPNPPKGLLVGPSLKIRWDFVVLMSTDGPVRVEVRRAPASF